MISPRVSFLIREMEIIPASFPQGFSQDLVSVPLEWWAVQYQLAPPPFSTSPLPPAAPSSSPSPKDHSGYNKQKSIVSVTSEPLLFNNFAWNPIFCLMSIFIYYSLKEISTMVMFSYSFKIRGHSAGWRWCTPLIPALGRQRQAALCEFEASLVYKS